MATIKKFEEIEAWKLSRELTREIYGATKNADFSHDYGLKDQIQRAAVSVMSNIAEGFERGGNKEFINFLCIAKGSCGEIRAQLYVALDLKYITEENFNHLCKLCNRISMMLYRLIDVLKKSSVTGVRYKRPED
ncbi:MAG: four helix bundle protein [Kiritimatiellae bacterium]|jgi:four helix bundle protein|nr:four helix bundle protein [Kiritimatiellia bacterium]